MATKQAQSLVAITHGTNHIIEVHVSNYLYTKHILNNRSNITSLVQLSTEKFFEPESFRLAKEQWTNPGQFAVGDETLPSSVGNIINHYFWIPIKQPVQWKVSDHKNPKTPQKWRHFEDPHPSKIQVQTLPLEDPRILREEFFSRTHPKLRGSPVSPLAPNWQSEPRRSYQNPVDYPLVN